MFKEAVKELARRASRQLWLNVKEGLKEFGRGLLVAKMPRGFEGHYRGGYLSRYAVWEAGF
jgi:hypothetical protein